jgi:hypothetical protein
MHLVTEADNGQVMLSSGGLLARQLESVILSGILEAGQHNYSRYLRPTRSAAAPRHVRRAEEFVRSNLDNPISLDDIANAAGVTPRSLQLGFRNFRNTSPMALLRSERLRRVHEELMAGAPGASVPAGDGLGLEEFLDAPDAAFAGAAGCLDAAEGGAGAARLAVHFDHARAQATGHAVALGAILALHIVGQAVDGVIGNLDRFFFVSNGIIDSTGPKISSRAMVMSLLTSAKTVGGRNSRGSCLRAAGAAGNQARTFVDTLLDQPWILSNWAGNHRADMVAFFMRVADLGPCGNLAALDRLVIDRALHQHAGRRVADWPVLLNTCSAHRA